MTLRKLVIPFSNCGCRSLQNIPQTKLHRPGSRNIRTTSGDLVIAKNIKGKSVSSQKWLVQQLNDHYVHEARKLGYRARSAFKLIEMNDKFKLLKPGQWLVDCGAAPGSWTQVCVPLINSDGKDERKPLGKIVSLDLLPIAPIPGAILLPFSDFTDPDIRQNIIKSLHHCPKAIDPVQDENSPGNEPPCLKPTENFQERVVDKVFDGVLSDMAPNASGQAHLDHARIIHLVRLALEFAVVNAKSGSFFVAKIWEGPDCQKFVKELEFLYKTVKLTKPQASRKRSAETYIVAMKKRQ